MNRSISVIVPAYNEETRLPGTIRAIQDYFRNQPWDFHEILIVDDGSKDTTAAIAGEFAKSDPRVLVLRNPGNRGKGYSVKHGMLKARGEWCLFSDADLSSPIEELGRLWNAAEHGADVAIGSRAIDPSLIGVHQPGFRETAGRVFNAAMRMSIGLPIRDTQCGFKLFRGSLVKEIFYRQTIERFGFDVEVLFIAQKLRYKIVEVPVVWNHVDGSKVGMMTGLRAFVELAEIKANYLRGRYRFNWSTSFSEP